MYKTVLMLLVFSVGALADGGTPSQPAAFSASRPGPAFPAGWTLKTLPNVSRATRFDLVDGDGGTVLRAVSDAATTLLLAAAAILNPRQ